MLDDIDYGKDQFIDAEVQYIKNDLGIDNDNDKMTDEEIKRVLQVFGARELDTQWSEDGTPIFGKEGINAMMTVTLYVFPWYFEKYGLSQFN
jgi:hypothetical protein